MRTATVPPPVHAFDPALRFASVYPLVTARSVARPFTYLAKDVEPGSIVAVPFGRSTRRGVVVSVGDEPPEGVEAVPVEAVVGRIPAPLVELALWIADFYGSTPARALALVAPPTRRRRTGARSSTAGAAARPRVPPA